MEGEAIRKLNCRHYFHHECIKLWVVRQQTCPNCKVNPFTGNYDMLSPEDEIAERNRRSREAARRAFNQLGLEA